jgi:hypothetical protein
MPVDSCGPASYRHFLTASRAAVARTGCPPINLAFLIEPLGNTVTSTLTTPLRLILLASGGYVGATLLFIFRLPSSCPQAWEAPITAHPPTSRRPTARTRFRVGKPKGNSPFMALLHLPSKEISPISKVPSRRYFGDGEGGLFSWNGQGCRSRVIGSRSWARGHGLGSGRAALRAAGRLGHLRVRWKEGFPRRSVTSAAEAGAEKRASDRSVKPLRHPKTEQTRSIDTSSICCFQNETRVSFVPFHK